MAPDEFKNLGLVFDGDGKAEASKTESQMKPVGRE